MASVREMKQMWAQRFVAQSDPMAKFEAVHCGECKHMVVGASYAICNLNGQDKQFRCALKATCAYAEREPDERVIVLRKHGRGLAWAYAISEALCEVEGKQKLCRKCGVETSRNTRGDCKVCQAKYQQVRRDSM